jgi:hypothetical protein
MSLEIELPPGAALPFGAHFGEPPRDAALALARFLGRVPTPPSEAEMARRCGSAAGGGHFGAHFRDDSRVVRCVEDGRTGNEGVGARRSNTTDIVDPHATVHFEADGLAA